MAGARVFRVEFRIAVARRILNGESVSVLSNELRIKRSVLYRWRDAYRLAGKDGFKKTRGRPPGSVTAAVKGKPGLTTSGDDGIYSPDLFARRDWDFEDKGTIHGS